MMIDNLEGLLALLVGVMLGVFYFAGLWWTVRKLGSSQYVVLLFVFSLLFRTSAVIAGFYLILGDNWLHLVAGLVGFMVVRFLATRYSEKSTEKSVDKNPQKESRKNKLLEPVQKQTAYGRHL
ncbi:ATP synthase subunit I [Colwellia sp. MB02u-6]|uniref:ATP synthase subunit I n=1 Tax=Colwellia sp. MB02u-6 TaxID=2759824 RepID=UPI0015F67D09|nr:ATP synthase subunit I [Colwellia sp. MB02u-6]MBA6327674.1 ATP synthase subunit I [Colwellia sp. MB02u-6]